jgi:predicted hydrolase (HD superfamily)
MPSRISRDEAWSLLSEWVTSESLRRHCLAVEAAMAAYAATGGHDEELWAVTRRDAPPEMVRAIAAHADFMGVPPESDMERTLVAVDELCGFLVACAYVRPEGIHGLTPKSVKKKLKQPSFAAAVDRDDVRGGAERIGADFDEHVAFVIAALEARADELALHGRGAVAE